METVLLSHLVSRNRMVEYDSHPRYTRAFNLFPYFQLVKPTRFRPSSDQDRRLAVQFLQKLGGTHSFNKSRLILADVYACNHQTSGYVEIAVKRQIQGKLMVVETRCPAANDDSVPPKSLSGCTNKIGSPACSAIRMSNNENSEKCCSSHSLKGRERNHVCDAGNVDAVTVAVKDQLETAEMKGTKPTPLPTVLDMLVLNEENEKQAQIFTSTFPPNFPPNFPHSRTLFDNSNKNKSGWGSFWHSMKFTKKSTSRSQCPEQTTHWEKRNGLNEKFDMSTFTTISLNDNSRPCTPNKTIKHKRSKISIPRLYKKAEHEDSHGEPKGSSTNPKIIIDDYDAGIQHNYLSKYLTSKSRSLLLMIKIAHSHIITSSAAGDEHVLEISDIRAKASIDVVEDKSARALKWTPQFAVYSGNVGDVQHSGFKGACDIFKSGRPDGWRKKMKEQNEREVKNPGEKELLYSWNAAQNLLEYIEGGQDLELDVEEAESDQEIVEETMPEEPSTPILERLEEIQAIVNQQREAYASQMTANRPQSYNNDFQNLSFLLNDDESFVNSTDLDSIHDINEGYESSQSSYTESKCGDNESVNEIQSHTI